MAYFACCCACRFSFSSSLSERKQNFVSFPLSSSAFDDFFMLIVHYVIFNFLILNVVCKLCSAQVTEFTCSTRMSAVSYRPNPVVLKWA